MRLRRKYENTPSYKAAVESGAILPIDVPPPRIEPMRYVSPRVTSEHASNHSLEPPSQIQEPQAPEGVQHAEPQKPRLAFLRPQKHRNDTSPKRARQKNTTESLIGELGGCLHGNGESILGGRITPIGNNELGQVIKVAGPPAISVKTGARQTRLQIEPHDRAAARGAELETDNTDALDGASTEPSLTDSEGGDVATSLRDKRSNIGAAGGHQLSYVHDFSDCPVNKSVLMYYEEEENKTRQPTPQVRSSSQLLSNNPYQQLLSSQTELSSPGAPSPNATDGLETTSHRKGLERHRERSSRQAATRSADDFAPTFLPSDLETRADKKATSF